MFLVGDLITTDLPSPPSPPPHPQSPPIKAIPLPRTPGTEWMLGRTFSRISDSLSEIMRNLKQWLSFKEILTPVMEKTQDEDHKSSCLMTGMKEDQDIVSTIMQSRILRRDIIYYYAYYYNYFIGKWNRKIDYCIILVLQQAELIPIMAMTLWLLHPIFCLPVKPEKILKLFFNVMYI